MRSRDFTNANRVPDQRSYSVSAHHIVKVALMIQKSSSYVLNYRKMLRKDLSGYSGSHQVIPVVGGKLEEINIS